MKPELVKTGNYERFRTAIAAVQNRGAPETCMVLAAGDPGVSKSVIVNRWAVDVKAVYVRAKVDWTPSRFIDALADRLKVDTGGRRLDLEGRIIGAITRARPVGITPVPIVIDEVQHCLKNRAATLEKVRDISDLAETIVVLVAGEPDVLKRIMRYPQISRRIFRLVDFQHASPADVADTCRQKSEVPIADDLVAEINRQCDGNMGHVINAIAAVEHYCRKNDKRRATLADFAGRALVVDWQTQAAALGAAGGR